MINCNLRMRKCFKFYVQECQNTSIETWIGAAKFRQKIPICSKNIHKIQIEFPRSEVHTPPFPFILRVETSLFSRTILNFIMIASYCHQFLIGQILPY